MDITAIYFSPTGGTKQYVQKIAGALGETYASLDLSDRETRLREHTFSKDDLVVIGVPVYYGRVVQIDNGLLKRLHGDGTRAILVAVYGNRAFDDALLELSDLCAKQDFVMAAAFTGIAQHTFSEKIATGRPNADDLLKAERFHRHARTSFLPVATSEALYCRATIPTARMAACPSRPREINRAQAAAYVQRSVRQERSIRQNSKKRTQKNVSAALPASRFARSARARSRVLYTASRSKS